MDSRSTTRPWTATRFYPLRKEQAQRDNLDTGVLNEIKWFYSDSFNVLRFQAWNIQKWAPPNILLQIRKTANAKYLSSLM